MEDFWTISFHKVINKKCKGPWVIVRNFKIIPLYQVTSLEQILSKYPDYHSAWNALIELKKNYVGNKRERIMWGKSKLIYVKGNSKGRFIISD